LPGRYTSPELHGKEKNMDLISEIEFWPADEVRKLMRAFGEAKEKRDTDSLVWCAERMLFLYSLSEEGEIEPSHEQIETMFTMAFRDNLPKPPALIAGMMAPDKEEESPAACTLQELDKLEALFDIHASEKDAGILREQVEKIRDSLAAVGEEAE
jgi:hypothetical protein